MSTTSDVSAVSFNVDDAFATAQDHVRRLITKYPGRTPIYTHNGLWQFDDDPWAPIWTGGFLAGMVWIIAERTGDAWWREQAEKYSLLLEHRKNDTGTHDLGFLFTPSWGRWHAAAPSESTTDTLVTAARTMAGRFHPVGKYLDTWVGAGSTFIDVMMNIGIIYQGAELSGDKRLADIASAHALTSRRFLVRGDASTVHEGWFDPETGQFLHAATHQGYRADSCWVRGHAWGIYGFGTAFRWTRDTRFLDTARSLADVYIIQTRDRLIPPNDWDDPEPEYPYEASAASVTASAMLQLAELLGPEGADYRDYAIRIVERLSAPDFLADPRTGWEGIIRQSTYHRRNDVGVNESVMWGDYYYVEALERLSAMGALA